MVTDEAESGETFSSSPIVWLVIALALSAVGALGAGIVILGPAQ